MKGKEVEIRKNDAEGRVLHVCIQGLDSQIIKTWMNGQSPNSRSPGHRQFRKAINGEGTIQAQCRKGQKPEPKYHLKVRKEPKAFVVVRTLCGCRSPWKLVDMTQQYRTINYEVLRRRHGNKE